MTIFHEPINIRAENVARINSQAVAQGISLKTDVFATRERWQVYAVAALQTVERLAAELALSDVLHLWPDKSLGNASITSRMSNPDEYSRWLSNCWSKISAWP